MSASKRKGTAFETDVVNYLRANGHPFAERRALKGARDCGDVTGVPGVVIEIKNVASMKLAEWCKEAATEAANDKVTRWVVVHKRKMHSTADAYATMPLSLLAELLAE
jgi:hypothetical protein